MLNDLLYEGNDTKIYKLDDNLIEPEFEVLSTAEQSPNSPETDQVAWVNAVRQELKAVAEFDPRPPGSSAPESCCHFKIGQRNIQGQQLCCAASPEPQIQVPPDELPGFQAVGWNNALGVDLRPHVWEPVLKKFLLCDSGSQITAFPPEPGDTPTPGNFLRAVNGSRIKTYGYKDIVIKIGRKPYNFKAIKADVESPVLGWDFMKFHKLALVWNEWGDNCIYDKKANITTALTYKSIPSGRSEAMKKLSLITENKSYSAAPPSVRGHVGGTANNLAFQVSAVENLTESEDINKIPDSPYKQLLQKYPEILFSMKAGGMRS